jgi:hypothetical protein
MKNILFCLLVLLACFRPNNSHATGTKPNYKFENTQKESSSCNKGFLKSSDDLLELLEDDNNDPEDELVSYEPGGSDIQHFISQDFYIHCLKQIYYNRDLFSRHLPVFILHQVFRL